MKTDFKLMMKCDMCYDRTSEGLKPMCATVCPSQALFFGTREQIESLRPRSTPTNRFQFGEQTITTRVNMMTPRIGRSEYIDVTAAMNEHSSGKQISLNVLMEGMYQEDDNAD
jgi:Fe-S-cluster-containing dehydrogenase component